MKKVLALVLSMLMVMSLIACGNDSTSTTAADGKTQAQQEGTTAEAEKQNDRTLVVQISEEPKSVDMTENATLLGITVGRNMVDTLVTNLNGEVVPMLAESWKWNDDYTEITFTLKDAKFSDGTTITSEDVVASLELTKSKGIKDAAIYAKIASMEAPDAKTVVLKLNAPFTPLLNNMCDCAYPVYSKAAIEAGADFTKGATVASGAYYVAEWKTGSYIILKANEYYHDEVPIKEVKLLFMPDENNGLVSLEAGEIDYMTGTGFALSGTSVQYLKDLDTIQLNGYASTGYNYIALNQGIEYFADKNVRMAIDYAINRNDVISVALDGYGTPASLPIIPGMGGYIEGYDATEQNIAKAKELMAASKYPNGFSFTLDCANARWVKVGQVVQSALKEIGITVTINETDTGTQATNNAANNYEAFIWSFGNSTGDVAGISLIYTAEGAKNYARFTDTTIGDAFSEANALAGDARLAKLKVAYDAIVDQVNYIGLFFPESYQAATLDLVFEQDATTGSGIPMFYRMYWK